jgi:acetyl-CoA acyltransferase
MRDAVIVEAVRTAHGKRNGALSPIHPVDLMADVLSALVARAGLGPDLVDDVVIGCVSQIGDQSSNVARFAVLAAGWPQEIPGVTVNRACGSSQQALDYAACVVMSGQAEIVVAGGVETMSRVPLGAARQVGLPYGPRVLKRYDDFSFNQGISAEMIAEQWGFSREQLDEYSVGSHEKAAAAIDSGAFNGQLVPIDVGGVAFRVDEGVRRQTSVEVMAGLKPSFKPDGLIHAGNSSQISDGAAAMLVMTSDRAREFDLTPFVHYRCGVAVGADPVLMLTGPIPATERLLKRTGIPLSEIGVYEVNEAFAPVPLAWMRDVGGVPERLNPLGGAIALGHPLGASGASLMTRMVHYMREHDIRFGLQTMCEGGGTANATLVELVP